MYLLPYMPPNVNFLGLEVEIKIASRSIHVYPIGTSGLVMAAHVHVAHSRDAVVVQTPKHLYRVQAHELVVVPGIAVGMHKENRVGEVIVVVDQICEVYLKRVRWID